MRVIKDIFFANVTGSSKDNHNLDLYLPDEYDEARMKEQHDCMDEARMNEQHDCMDGNVKTSRRDAYDSVCDNREIVDTKTELKEQRGDRNNNINRNGSKTWLNDANGSPLVIFVHGGGWRRGGKEAWTHYLYFDVNFLVVLLSTLVGTYKNVGKALAQSGIACAVISYPLTEAGLGCLLMELLMSYIQSCCVVFLASIPILGLIISALGFSWSSTNHWWTVFHDDQPMFLKTSLIVMLVTNIITTFLLSFKRKEYKLRSYQIRTMWVLLMTGASFISFVNNNKLILSVILTLLINQSIILRLRLRRCGGCYEDQTMVLAKAVKWAKTTGQDTGVFDTSRVYLMGHSAGGHLVSLTVLDNDILATVDCSSKDIKGVVSLSGVYDLMCLRGPFLRPFYLLPTFGHCQTTWLRASPSHLIKQKIVKEHTPKFLIMTAENDLFLKHQSWQFSENLQEADVDCRHIEVMGTNHFTIVTSLMKRFTGNDKSVLTHIMLFIHN